MINSTKLIKLGIFLFGISLLLFNCNQDETEILSQEKVVKKKNTYKTVSLEQAKTYINNYKEVKKRSVFARGDSFNFEPKWETLKQDSLNFTEALLTDLDIESNIELVEGTKLFFLEVNDSIVSAIKTNIVEETFEDGNLKRGRIFFHNLEGNFSNGYTVEEGRLHKRLVPKQTMQQASFFAFLQTDTSECNGTGPLNVDDLSGNCFDVVDLGTIAYSDDGGSIGSPVLILYGDTVAPGQGTDPTPDNDSYNVYINTSGTGSTSNNNNDQNNCPSDREWNSATQTCDCKGENKVENPITGNCIDDPCVNNDELVYNEETGKCDCKERGKVNVNGVCVNEDIKCNRLKRLVQNDSIGSNILPTINQLRVKLPTGNNEWSITFKNKWVNGIRKNVPNVNGIEEGTSKNQSYFDYGTTFVGQIHTHPEGTDNMFSWKDVRAIKLLYTDSHNDFNDEIFVMIVTPNNITYALKIDNIIALTTKIEEDMQRAKGSTDKKKIENIMEEMANEYKKSNNLKKTFLNLFNDYGISLYEATDANLSNWKQLTLDENNDVKEIPCN